ncbi:unnamed protein product [Closterium sp. Naga37s-1]|nr:unnamed protein product [Closterium sp. Naga37s-1]
MVSWNIASLVAVNSHSTPSCPTLSANFLSLPSPNPPSASQVHSQSHLHPFPAHLPPFLLLIFSPSNTIPASQHMTVPHRCASCSSPSPSQRFFLLSLALTALLSPLPRPHSASFSSPSPSQRFFLLSLALTALLSPLPRPHSASFSSPSPSQRFFLLSLALTALLAPLPRPHSASFSSPSPSQRFFLLSLALTALLAPLPRPHSASFSSPSPSQRFFLLSFSPSNPNPCQHMTHMTVPHRWFSHFYVVGFALALTVPSSCPPLFPHPLPAHDAYLLGLCYYVAALAVILCPPLLNHAHPIPATKLLLLSPRPSPLAPLPSPLSPHPSRPASLPPPLSPDPFPSPPATTLPSALLLPRWLSFSALQPAYYMASPLSFCLLDTMLCPLNRLKSQLKSHLLSRLKSLSALLLFAGHHALPSESTQKSTQKSSFESTQKSLRSPSICWTPCSALHCSTTLPTKLLLLSPTPLPTVPNHTSYYIAAPLSFFLTGRPALPSTAADVTSIACLIAGVAVLAWGNIHQHRCHAILVRSSLHLDVPHCTTTKCLQGASSPFKCFKLE